MWLKKSKRIQEMSKALFRSGTRFAASTRRQRQTQRCVVATTRQHLTYLMTMHVSGMLCIVVRRTPSDK